MSTPILPFAVWASGTNQNSIPANDNSLRNQILNGLVIADDVTAQPVSPSDGDIYILPSGATGDQWDAFDEDDLTIYQGGTWYAFAPVEGVVVNLDGASRQFDGSDWTGFGGLPDAPSDGTGYVRKDGAWAAESGSDAASWGTITGTLADQTDLQAALDAKAGATGAPIITEATTARDIAPADAGSYHRFTATGAKTATFDDSDGFTAGQEFHIANRAASDNLTLTAAGSMTLNPPKGGTLVLEPGDTVTVKMVATDEADVFGSAVAA